jgi:hypothetical protein
MSDFRKLLNIVSETTSGSVAAVAAPLGEPIKRESAEETPADTPKVLEYGMWENSALTTSNKLKKKRGQSKVVKSIYGESAFSSRKQTITESYSDFDLRTTILNPDFDDQDDNSQEEIVVGVDFDVSGQYSPATWGYYGGEPEEYPEIEIRKIVNYETGEDITRRVNDSTIEQLIDKGYEKHRSGPRMREGVAEGSDVEYIVVIRDEQGKRSIRVSALTPTDAKEKAEAQGYKVLKVKDPNESHYFREQGVAEGGYTDDEIRQRIQPTFQATDAQMNDPQWMRARGLIPLQDIQRDYEETKAAERAMDAQRKAASSNRMYEKQDVTKGSNVLESSSQSFILLDPSLADKIEQMVGTFIDQEDDHMVVWSNNPNTTTKLMAFAKTNSERLKVSSYMSPKSNAAIPTGGAWSKDNISLGEQGTEKEDKNIDPLQARSDYAKRHGQGQVYKKAFPGDKHGMTKSYAYDIKRSGPKGKLPKESVENEVMEEKTQKYEMMLRNGQVKKFVAKDDADAKRIAKGHGAKSLIRLKGGVPAGKVAEQNTKKDETSGFMSDIKHAKDQYYMKSGDNSVYRKKSDGPDNTIKRLARKGVDIEGLIGNRPGEEYRDYPDVNREKSTDKEKSTNKSKKLDELAPLAIPLAAAGARAVAPYAARAIAPVASRIGTALSRPASTTATTARSTTGTGSRVIDMGKAVEVPKTALPAPAKMTAGTPSIRPPEPMSFGKQAAMGLATGAAAIPAIMPDKSSSSTKTEPATSASTTTAQPAQVSSEPQTFKQAFAAARASAAASGDPSTGRFTWKGKEYQTNLGGDSGEKYVSRSQQRDVGDSSLKEAQLEEQDLIINPASISKLSRDLVSKSHDRTDHEVGMALSDLYQAGKNATKVFSLLKGVSEQEGIEGWVQEKIIKAADYLNTIREYLEGKQLGIGEGKPGLWANIHSKRERIKGGSGERMRKPGSKGAPSSQDFKDAAKTSKK